MFEPSWRLNTTAPGGGAGKAGLALVPLGSATAGFAAPEAGAGPGVRWPSTTTMTAATAPSPSAPIAASSRGQTEASAIGRGLRRGALAPSRLEHRGEQDRERVKRHERQHLERRGHGIDPRERDGERGDDDDSDAPVPAQLGRRDDSQAHEREDEHRHLEDERHGEQAERRERVVVTRANEDRV